VARLDGCICTLSFVRVDSTAQPRSSDARLRGALLLPVCALAVHQGRYYLAFGGRAGARLSREGHSYLTSVEPFVLLAAALALGGLIGKIVRTWQRAEEPAVRRRHGAERAWAICSLALFTLYCGQELCEGVFAAGHPAGVAGILGHGGWIAAPLAVLVGGALAAALRVAQTLIVLAARAAARSRTRSEALLAPRFTMHTAGDWRLEPQSGVVAGRAPPLALSRS
jgi:hypothetical protein